ncbi:MAG: hypothetical protein GXO64_05110 [Candidatus Micrarchaeota archaeon]|nr:hypothetical protein [Candidatus Micrarchaeota archaeon]
MGSLIEINDTLQLSSGQGFPKELDYEKHKTKPFTAKEFEGRVFEFFGKEGIRLYQVPPVRNFLVQNIGGKWLYWGLVHITEVRHDNINRTTSGKFKIVYIYTPEEMKAVHGIVDRDKETDFFESSAKRLSV